MKPLPIPERPWQHVSIDFHELPIDRNGYNMAMIIVNHFGKRLFSIPCHKDINAKEAAQLYIYYVYHIYRLLNIIVFNRGL